MYRRGCAGGRCEDGRNMSELSQTQASQLNIYAILSVTNVAYLLAASVNVGFQSRHPDEETVNDVHRELQENNIDVSQLVQRTADHCEQTESSTARESPAVNQTLS